MSNYDIKNTSVGIYATLSHAGFKAMVRVGMLQYKMLESCGPLSHKMWGISDTYRGILRL